jgi:hypothetical protein
MYVAEAEDETRLEHSDDDDAPDNSDLFTPPATRLSLVAPVPALSLPQVPYDSAASNLSSAECLTLINQWNATLPEADRIPTHDPLVLFRDACDVMDRMKRLSVPMLGLEAIPEGFDAFIASMPQGLPDSGPDSDPSSEPDTRADLEDAPSSKRLASGQRLQPESVNTASPPEKLRSKRQAEVQPIDESPPAEGQMEGSADQSGFSEQDEPPRLRPRTLQTLTVSEARAYIAELQYRNPGNVQIQELATECDADEDLIWRGTRAMEVMLDTPPGSPIKTPSLDPCLLSDVLARKVAVRDARLLQARQAQATSLLGGNLI